MFTVSFDWLIVFLTMQNVTTNVIVVDILGGCCDLYSFQKKKLVKIVVLFSFNYAIGILLFEKLLGQRSW